MPCFLSSNDRQLCFRAVTIYWRLLTTHTSSSQHFNMLAMSLLIFVFNALDTNLDFKGLSPVFALFLDQDAKDVSSPRTAGSKEMNAFLSRLDRHLLKIHWLGSALTCFIACHPTPLIALFFTSQRISTWSLFDKFSSYLSILPIYLLKVAPNEKNCTLCLHCLHSFQILTFIHICSG